MFAFPALLPMIPGMFAYKAILATMQFLGTADMPLRQELLVSIVYNSLTTFFIMCALVIGAVLPLFLFHRESPWSGACGESAVTEKRTGAGIEGKRRGNKNRSALKHRVFQGRMQP